VSTVLLSATALIGQEITDEAFEFPFQHSLN